jgi:iron complex outermembrane receptor protein
MRFTLALAILILSASALSAADGRITGRVTRTDGSPLAGVVVQALGASTAAITDTNGAFQLDGIAPGTYTLNFSAGEYTATEANVTVSSGQTARVAKTVDWRISMAETITVTTASRRTERIVEAPAAVSVASEQTIEAAAATGQAPRIVENAPGVDFTQSGLYDFNFNARGFNSSLNRRILTLIDGRDPSVPFLGSQEWAALSYPIDEMASVELVRGPGSALYGANAFSGVLNMTTKMPRDTAGGRVQLTAGDLSTKRGDFRHAGGFGNEIFYRIVGGYQESDDFSRSRNAGVEYAGLPVERVPLALNEVQTAFGGLRIDKHLTSGDIFSVEGGYAYLEGPVFQTGIGRVQVTDVSRPWARANYNMRHFNFLTYYDARIAENQVALSSGAPLWEDSYNLHGEVQTNWDFLSGRSRIVGGVALNRQDVDTANDVGVQTLMAQAQSEDSQSAFGQIEFDVTNTLKLLGAARYDSSDLFESQFSPKAALVYEVSPQHSVRVGYNEAFQRPNYSELFLSAPAGAPANLAAAAAANPAAAALAPVLTQLGFAPLPILARGNGALDVEKVKSYEVGYSGIYGGRLYFTADAYKSRLTNFVTDLLPGVNTAFAPYQIPTTLPAAVQAGLNGFLRAALATRFGGLSTVDGRPALVFSYTNAGEVDTQGGEVAFNYYVTNNWMVDFNYSYFDFEVQSSQVGDQLLPNAPENKFNAGLAFRSTNFDAKVAYRWVEEFPWAAGVFVGTVPQYDVVNVSARYNFGRFGVGAEVTNALDDEHFETFGGDILQRRALAFITVGW